MQLATLFVYELVFSLLAKIHALGHHSDGDRLSLTWKVFFSLISQELTLRCSMYISISASFESDGSSN